LARKDGALSSLLFPQCWAAGDRAGAGGEMPPMTMQGEASARERMRCFDGLRGVLASYVVLHHMVPLLALDGAAAKVARLFEYGGAAVDVFLILSGLVILQSLAVFHDRALPFLAARAARLLPCYLLALAMAMLAASFPLPWDAMDWLNGVSSAREQWPIGWPDQPLTHVVLHLTMAHGLLPNAVLPYADISLLGPAWSLSNEWQFYVLIAALVAWFHCQLWVIVMLLLLLAAVALPTNDILLGGDDGFTMAFLPLKAHYFALGIATTVLFRPQVSAADAWRLLLCLGATMLIAGLSGGLNKLPPLLAWAACALAQRLPTLTLLSPLRRVLQSPPLLWLGAISYPLYLVHDPVLRLLVVVLAPWLTGHGLAFTLLWGGASVLLALGLAAWMRKHVELPGIAWGKAMLQRRWQTRSTALPPLASS
jgi:peptidoglycan/LPS O-acetylase OafA/YrhL